MLSSLLLKYFKNLTKKDRRELSKFVNSPFHNQREETIRLFDYVNEHFDTPSVKNGEQAVQILKKEFVFASIFREKKDFNDALMRATMSHLTDLIKDFLVHNELKNSTQFQNEKSLMLRKSLLERGFYDEYERHLIHDFDQTSNDERVVSFHRYLILDELNFWHSKQKRSGKLFFNEMSDTVNAGYVIELLRLASSMQSHKSVINVEYNLTLLEPVLKLIESGWFKDHLYVQAFYHGYWTMQYRAENYAQLDKILTESPETFNTVDLHFLYKIVLNYNARKSNLNEPVAFKEIWKYYKNGFEKKILIHNNTISPHDFIAVVALGLSKYVQDVPWVDSFIKDHIKYLPFNDRANYSCLIEGIYHFYLKKYEISMLWLKKVTFEDEHHQLRSRRMLTIIYYELKEFDMLASHLDSFRVYLHRQKTMAYQKEGHLSFIRFFEKFLKINLNNEKECIVLWEQIQEIPYVAMSEWFKDKLSVSN